MCNAIDYKSILTGLDVLKKVGVNPIELNEVCGIKLEQSFSENGIVCEFYTDPKDYLSKCIVYHYLDSDKKSLEDLINIDLDDKTNLIELSSKLELTMFSELDYFLESNKVLISNLLNEIQSVLPRIRKVRLNSSTSDQVINQVYRFAKIIRIYSYDSSDLDVLGYCPNLIYSDNSIDENDVNDFMNSYCGMSFIDSGLELTDENSYLVGLLVNKLLGGSF